MIKDCGTGLVYSFGACTSKLQVMNVGVNKPFKRYAKQAYKTFMFGNTNTGKVRREGIVK